MAETSTPSVPIFYGKPFFRGGQERGALIRFTSDPDGAGPQSVTTVWFVDPKTKQLVPIINEQAFNDFFTETLAEAAANGRIVDLPLTVLQPGGALEGYAPLSDDQGIQPGGVRATPKTTQIDTDAVANHYGQAVNEAEQKNSAMFLLGKNFDGSEGWLNWIKNNEDTISDEVINNIINDRDTLALYIGAMAYGGYTPPAIYSDLKRRQLLKEGNTAMASIKVIDEAKTADEYYATSGGNIAKNHPDLIPPDYLGEINMNMMDSLVYNLPDELFEVLVPPFDWSSEEGQAAMDEVKTVLYDVITKQVEARTDQEWQAANYAWDKFRSDLKRQYNISLSNNAEEAWNQLENLSGTYSGRGLLNTGFHQLALDKMMADRRQADTRLREEKLTAEEEKKRQYYLQYATPEQIKNDLTDEEREKWGLRPGQDTLSWFTAENLKAQYPDLSDEEIKRYASSIIDEYGNYRSALTQKLQEQKFGSYGVPEGGLELAKQGYKQTMAQAKADLDEEDAYKEFSKGDPFSKDYNLPKETAKETPPAASLPNSQSPAPYVPPAPGFNPYAESQAAYTAKTGLQVPGYETTPPSGSAPTGIHVKSPDWLKYYKPEELQPYKPGEKIYLKPGVKQRW